MVMKCFDCIMDGWMFYIKKWLINLFKEPVNVIGNPVKGKNSLNDGFERENIKGAHHF